MHQEEEKGERSVTLKKNSAYNVQVKKKKAYSCYVWKVEGGQKKGTKKNK